MFKMIQKLKEKIQSKLSQKGQGMVEYAIIIAVVAVIAIAVLNGTTTTDANNQTTTDGSKSLKGAITTAFESAADKVKAAGN